MKVDVFLNYDQRLAVLKAELGDAIDVVEDIIKLSNGQDQRAIVERDFLQSTYFYFTGENYVCNTVPSSD